MRALALFALFCGLTLWMFAGYCVVNDTPLKKADVIIVLGAKANEDGTLSPTLASRMDAGISLWKAGYAPYLLVTGNAVANRQVEALAMAAYAKANGVAPRAIIIEPRAHDTRENAAYAAIAMGQKKLRSAIIVTSRYHTHRAQLLFAAQQIPAQYVAVEYPPDVGVGGRLYALLHEAGGYAKLFVVR